MIKALKAFALSSICVAVFAAPRSLFARSLVVISGGYQSCPETNEFFFLPQSAPLTKILKAAHPFLSDLKSLDSETPDLIWSCYSGVQSSGGFVNTFINGPIDFTFGPTAAGSNLINFKSVDDLQDGRGLSQFFNLVKSRIYQTKPDHVYLVGHSYGGWTAIQLGIRLTREGLKISGVTVTDPISPFQCPAHVMGKAVAATLGRPLPGCQTAPRDFLVSDMNALAANADWLVNIYQDRQPILHSTPMHYDGWVDEYFNDPNTYYLFAGSHSAATLEPFVWLKSAELARHARAVE